ncbi:MAG TPA: XRE family transcriptional regulator [Actinomycetes bacterium]|nr:XRE family transcriptional regulator [Actinomycetes bacterium]
MSVVDLGASLRAERLRQGLSLRETARRLGISASALSQIETGKAHPSAGKLFDIVNLLNVSVDGLLAGQAVVARGDEGFVSVQRTGEHEALDLESGVRWHRLTAGSYPGVEFLHVQYQPGGCSTGDGTFMRHAGQEFGYVLSGRLTISVGFDTHRLGPGDSISFPATTPHRLGNDGPEPATAIWCIIGRHPFSNT